MPFNTRTWKLTVTFLDGRVEEGLGEPHLKDNTLELYTDVPVGFDDNSHVVTGFPLCNIRKYTLEAVNEPMIDDVALHHEDTLVVVKDGEPHQGRSWRG